MRRPWDWFRQAELDLAAYVPSESVGVAVDVLVYTTEEAADWSARFRAEVERGVVLYRRQE